jgi:hypothetical protein
MEWSPSLINDIACRRAVLFFGSGISMNSITPDGTRRPKSWWQFINDASLKLGSPNSKKVKDVKALLQKNDLLTACEAIKRGIGREAFVELMKEEFQTPGYRPGDVHEHLWKLDLRITITPNFDNIYDSLVVQRGNGTVTIKTYSDDDVADALRRDERVLIKSHGTITHPNKLIFSRSDYADARNTFRDFYDLVYSLLKTYTFIFVGCGLEDPDIRYLLEDYCFTHKFARQHYFVMASNRFSPPIKAIFEDTLKIKLIEYAYSADHGNLTLGLKELAEKVEQRRIDIAKSMTW